MCGHSVAACDVMFVRSGCVMYTVRSLIFVRQRLSVAGDNGKRLYQVLPPDPMRTWTMPHERDAMPDSEDVI